MKCRGCGISNDIHTIDVAGVGPMHVQCELLRLNGLLAESEEMVKQLRGHVLPDEFISIRREHLARLQGIEEVVNRFIEGVEEVPK